jgi:hypothetical protein
MNTETIKNTLQSKTTKKIIGVFLIAVITLLIFTIGMRVGYMKAGFANNAGDNFYQPLSSGGPRHMAGFIQDATSGAHGASGKIISINLPTIVIADKDSTEKIVHIESETIIRKDRNTIAAENLQPGDFVVVIGEPNDSVAEVDARLIRVLPPPPMMQNINTP